MRKIKTKIMLTAFIIVILLIAGATGLFFAGIKNYKDLKIESFNNELNAISEHYIRTGELEQIKSFAPTKNSFLLVADTEKDEIKILTDKNTGIDLTGTKASVLTWYNSVSNSKDGNVRIYYADYYCAKRVLSENLILVVNVPKTELFNNADAVFLYFILSCLGFLLISMSAANIILNYTVKKPLKEIENNLAEKDNIIGNLKESSYLSVAAGVQNSLLNNDFSSFLNRDEFSLFAKNISPAVACGDFYDMFLIGEDKLFILAGDVAGKGIEATVYMSVIKTIINSLSRLPYSVDTILNMANSQLFATYNNGQFASVFLGMINLKSGVLSFVNAGFTKPVIVNETSGEIIEFTYSPDFVAGALPDTEYTLRNYEMNRGDKLLVFSDSLILPQINGKTFGRDKVTEYLSSNYKKAPEEIVEGLLSRLDELRDGIDDDIMLMCINYKGELEFETEMTAPANIDALSEVLEFVNSEMSKAHFNQKEIMQMSLAAEEIFINIASYAYNQSKLKSSEWDSADKNSKTIFKRGFVTIRSKIIENPKKIVLRFEDNGTAYNPLNKENENHAPSDEGGMGIMIVKSVASYINYERKRGKNILTVSKRG